MGKEVNEMCKFNRTAFLVWLLFASTLLGAPAPMAKRPKPEEGPNPSRLMGDWTLRWFGNDYVYRFGDGTYTHVRDNPDDYDYSGTWSYSKGVLTVTEYVDGRYVLKHELIMDGARWVPKDPEKSHKDTSLRRFGIIF